MILRFGNTPLKKYASGEEKILLFAVGFESNVRKRHSVFLYAVPVFMLRISTSTRRIHCIRG